jgi:polyisoprenoid-binding protein YceI
VEGPTPEIKDPWGSLRAGATAKTKISRKDFGLSWNQVMEAGGLMVGDEISITVDVEVVRRAA